jgi:hypothetical protein
VYDLVRNWESRGSRRKKIRMVRSDTGRLGVVDLLDFGLG